MLKKEVKRIMLKRMPAAGNYLTQIKNFGIYRREISENKDLCIESCFYQPMITLIIQGEKSSLHGTKLYNYKEGDYLLTSIDIPTINTIKNATIKNPFLSLSLLIDNKLIKELLIEYPELNKPSRQSFSGIIVSKVEDDLMSAFYRLLKLLDKPEQISVLAPLIIKEIHYLLLIGPFGEALISICMPETKSYHIANTISWLKKHFREPIKMEQLAYQANMSLSSFYRHFKKVTSLSPLQFQKQLRLHEGRRLMVSENMTAIQASLKVGYESATQFNREYKNLFHQTPLQDVQKIRKGARLV
ncbi:AraC family transcriptional regulator [Gilliamella sp. wkB308]|uniref:AraC family transcriptional regulator n=1 Tax=Gilliamella sp. wkB308 TaxID=3120263 RepID=UPI00080DA046|nr:AraC family transcriptional regulator [Gilliamella apicola]OCG01732.1 hypothetical protein A9G10_03160 [Gilliamella apicola]